MSRVTRLPMLALLALTVALGFGVSGAAQVAQPSPGATPGGEVAHPAAIHEGTCQNPIAEPVADLGQTAPFGVGAEEQQEVGSTEQAQVQYTSGTFDGSLEDLTAAQHIIAVHVSPDEFGTLIVCGEIAGIIAGESMIIGLYPAPGYESFAGVATLTGADDQTEIAIYLLTAAAMPMATPEA